MKRSGDAYPHKPSPGHTLDEVLKSLRDLIRNDLPAGLAAGLTTDLSDQPPGQPSPPPDDVPPSGQPEFGAPPSLDPDPTSNDLVSEVVAGLERELAELDELDPPIASSAPDGRVHDSDAPDEAIARLEPARTESFSADDVHRAIEDGQDAPSDFEENADDSTDAGDSVDPELPMTDPDSGTEALADDGDVVPHEIPETARDAEPAADSDTGSETPFKPEMEIPGKEFDEPQVMEVISEPPSIPESSAEDAADTEVSIDPGIAPESESDREPESVPPPQTDLFAASKPSFVNWAAKPSGDHRELPVAPPTRLRDSLALIAPNREAATAPSLARGPRLDPIGEAATANWSSYPVPASSGPPKPAAPSDTGGGSFPESEAIPLLDDAIESELPPDFAVRVRAIAIQVAARLDHEMRRAGRTPIAHDLVPTLARILEEALAQEFAQHQNDSLGEKEAATAPDLVSGRTSEASRASLSARGPRLDPIGDEQ